MNKKERFCGGQLNLSASAPGICIRFAVKPYEQGCFVPPYNLA